MEYIVSLIVGAILQWLSSLGVAAYKRQKSRSDNERDASQSVDPLKKAQTGKEIDDATDDALNGF